MGFVFNKIHSSGRYDRSPTSLAAAVRRYMQHAILITLTETERPERKRALRALCLEKNWGFVTGQEGPKNDGSILYDKSEFVIVHFENHQLSNKVFRIGKRTTPHSYATIVVLRHIATGLVFVTAVYHTPSGVEGDLYHHSKTARVVTWLTNVRALRRRVNALKRHHNAVGAIISCDWNINWHKRWVRVIMKTMFPAWNSTWKRHTPKGGTHGRRLIDWSLARDRLRIISSDLFADDASSDHRPFIERIRIF